ncbi:MAG: ribulose-phosphate 3-epimerase [Oscillospiraceae bacterium]|nr:ribulose-phosphate 3-epimerase [Oscillospiraceae bacterium]
MKTLISASILSADFACLGDEINKAVSHGCDWIHFDVMDGHFVPNISYGVPVLKSVKKCTDKPFDVHLMISKPFDYIEAFANAGADIITFHVEAECDIAATIQRIKDLGVKAGLTLKPATPAEAVYPYLNDIDMVLVMTVEPGFGGQSFMTDMLEKIQSIRKKADEIGKDLDIEVDGGIDGNTAPLVKSAGANVLVSGSYLFKAKDIDSAIASLLA